jgi:DNA-binding GntR family transcriptional regulator
MNRFDSLEPVERTTTPGIIADRIREAIINGSLPPGMQLTEAGLSERLRVSRGPVREAMQRLIQEGLLRNERHRGVFVVELKSDDVDDIYLARAAIERTAVSLLAQRPDQRALAALQATVEAMERAASSERWSALADLDLRFHEALVAATNSKRLMRMFRTLMAETRMCVMGLEPGYPVWADLVDEHRAILAAMRRGAEAEVLELLDVHFRSAVRDLHAANAVEPTDVSSG